MARLTPRDFPTFFTQLREGKLAGFRSNLDTAILPLTDEKK